MALDKPGFLQGSRAGMRGALAVPSSLTNQGLVSRPGTLVFMFRLFNVLPSLGSSFF